MLSQLFYTSTVHRKHRANQSQMEPIRIAFKLYKIGNRLELD